MTIDLPLTPEQSFLQGSVQRVVADHPRPDWPTLSALGLGGVGIAEAAGGFGGGALDMALVAAELGPTLAAADWVSHMMAGWLIGQARADHALIPELVAGSTRAAIVCPASTAEMPAIESGCVGGEARLVSGGAEAELFVLAGTADILLVRADRSKIEQRHRIMHDGTVAADLAFMVTAADIEPLVSGEPARALAMAANDMMLVTRCAEAAGLMTRMLVESVGYLGERQQFGGPIASFQALRHRLADMKLALMKAGAATEIAILTADRESAGRARVVSAACVEVGDAVRIVGEGAVQMHGAMGLTEELALGGHFKRALAIAAAFGPGHLARFAGDPV
ncbi:alkylation response protein AidB-like acyl-CoA dehydrogenase [Sphingopyxis panaciterrae]|uniref:acyl-CoA dehydrogenase family protein n=1 Tax=Sphingopyxis panaciterrae TaxID=363841 RepID=UPI001423CBE5|nr:acyl-CoA dehydrogenase family protein [Sphingopyxis panaciterrae]NIJ35423.1 alkylation response protein AidB-like acyl-CoA dehydrogenase [Sphingopyxis panaciterrae]